jgi:hypothetical protein
MHLLPVLPWSLFENFPNFGGSVVVTYTAGTKMIRVNQAVLMCTSVLVYYDVNNKKAGASITVLQLPNSPFFGMLISALFFLN